MPKRTDEGSSLIMAVIVMTVLATMTIALQARTLSSFKFMRHAQDYDAALAAADAGLAKAVYRIENGQIATWTESGSTDGTTCGTPVTPACDYEFHAENIANIANPTEFIVSVRGTVRGSSHAVRAKVTRNALFPYALFGYQNLRIDGSTAVGANMQFTVAGTVGAPVLVGSNGMVTCNGPTAANVQLRSAGGFSGCPSTQWQSLDQKQPRLDIEPPPSPNRACPTDGSSFGSTTTITTLLTASSAISGILGISGLLSIGSTISTPVQVIDGQNGVPFVCRQNVDLNGVIEVINPPVKIYVLDNASGACSTLDLDNAQVNATALAGGVLRKARDFQIYKDGDCALNLGPGNTSNLLTYNGVLYAPDSTVSIDGGKLLQGSIMVGQVKVNGAPNLFINWDSDLNTYYGQKWRVSRYAEVSPAELPAALAAP